MGGTIRKLADMQSNIRLVMFSAGAEGYASIAEKDTICATRENETRQVCQLLGISSYRNLNCLDWDLKVNNALYNEVIGEIRSFKPDVIFTHRFGDYNDHQSVSKVVNEAWFHAALECAAVNGPVHPMVPLYEFEVIEMMPDAGFIIDITDTFQTKLDAMQIYASQVGVVGGAGQLITGRALLRGQQVNIQYGEAFRRSSYRPALVQDLNKLI